MNEVALDSNARRNRTIRSVFLALALLTSPALCCGGLQLLNSLPASWLPSSLDFTVNLFESTARVENHTSRTLYITAITTTYGHPRIISQNIAFRQRDIPVSPKGSVVLQYDSADLPLSGIVVCRNRDNCRLLPASNSDIYEVDSYESLGTVEPSWLEAVQASPWLNYGAVMVVVLSLVPIFLFSGWFYMKWREKKNAG
jgi:hypothetical protein